MIVATTENGTPASSIRVQPVCLKFVESAGDARLDLCRFPRFLPAPNRFCRVTAMNPPSHHPLTLRIAPKERRSHSACDLERCSPRSRGLLLRDHSVEEGGLFLIGFAEAHGKRARIEINLSPMEQTKF